MAFVEPPYLRFSIARCVVSCIKMPELNVCVLQNHGNGRKRHSNISTRLNHPKSYQSCASVPVRALRPKVARGNIRERWVTAPDHLSTFSHLGVWSICLKQRFINLMVVVIKTLLCVPGHARKYPSSADTKRSLYSWGGTTVMSFPSFPERPFALYSRVFANV